jgi:hypothetical protein
MFLRSSTQRRKPTMRNNNITKRIKTMKKRVFTICAVVMLIAASLAYAWHTESRDVVFTGNVVFEKNAKFTVAPTLAGSSFVGTAAQTYTFPTTTATLARTDAAQTFTGTQTFSGSIVAANIDTALAAVTLALNADGNTTLYTVPTGKRAVLTKAVLVAAADAGTTTLTIGQAGAPNDFLGTQTLSNINAQYDVAILQPVPNATTVLSKSYAAGTVIKGVVGSQAGAAGNTLYLFGFLY